MARLSPVFMLGASLAATLLTQSSGQGQGVLVGCRLGATLQCVPGLTMTPQKQIKVLKQQITTDTIAEGMVEQTIEGLRQFDLTGSARVGARLTAELDFDPDQFDAVQVHWYRQLPGQRNWQLVGEVDSRSYRIGSDDTNGNVMAVVAMRPNGGAVMRHSSNVIGPIGG